MTARDYNNAGIKLFKTGKTKEAIKNFKKALSLYPSYKIAKFNLAVCYNNIGAQLAKANKLESANKYFLLSIKTDPGYGIAYSNLVDSLLNICDWKSSHKYGNKLDKLVGQALKSKLKSPETPFLNMVRHESPRKNLTVAKSWSNYIDKEYSTKRSLLNFSFNKIRKSKINIGYVSDGFQDFPTMHNLNTVLKLHNRQKFNVSAYSYGNKDETNWRNKAKRVFDSFVDIKNLSASETAKRIYKDNIDILVDLKGHTRNSRLEVFSLKPAPIQLTYLGFPGSTGAKFIDYIIADKIVIPAKQQKYYSEKITYLPNCYRPTDNQLKLSRNKFTRKQFGFNDSDFVFSSFNQPYKITPKVFDTWINILKKVPDSVLWLWERVGDDRKNLRAYAKQKKLNPKRLIFSKRLKREEHLARISLSDLALDTTPVNGHTTTVDYLWAEVPVVTTLGSHFASRVSASVLSAIGLRELITNSLKEYEKLAISFATNKKLLLSTRIKLKINKKTHPLFNSLLYTRNLEKIYTKMYKYYKLGKRPVSLRVN